MLPEGQIVSVIVRLKPSLRTMDTTNYFSGDFHPASREIKQERRST
jgi:hypothetical protein